MEPKCQYELPEDIKVLSFPIRDYSFRPPEEFYLRVAIPVSEWLNRGGSVLIHCMGGIGRSGTAVAMILRHAYNLNMSEALRRVKKFGDGPESRIQELVLHWFDRALTLLGKESWRRVLEFALQYNFGNGIEHASTVANIALDVLEALGPGYGIHKAHLKAAYIAGIFHDLGRAEVGNGHHKVSVEIAKRFKDLEKLANPDIVFKAIYHHRRSTDLLGDSELASLGKGAVITAAAVRLADAFSSVYNWEQYEGVYIKDQELKVKGNPLKSRFIKKSQALATASKLKAKLELV